MPKPKPPAPVSPPAAVSPPASAAAPGPEPSADPLGWPVPSAKEFARRRRALGLTRRQLALVARLNLASGYRTVQRVETGQLAPSGPLLALLQALEDGWRPPWWDAALAGGAEQD